MKKTDKRQRTRWELVAPGTNTRIPIPEGATDDDLDELVITNPELIARAERDRAERDRAERDRAERRRRQIAPANGHVPDETRTEAAAGPSTVRT